MYIVFDSAHGTGNARLNPARPANRSRICEANNFFSSLPHDLKYCILFHQTLNRTFSLFAEIKKKIKTFLQFFSNLFDRNYQNCSESCIQDTSCTYCLPSQFYHYQTFLFTIFHVSILYAGVLNNFYMTKQYAGVAECLASAQQHSGMLSRAYLQH